MLGSVDGDVPVARELFVFCLWRQKAMPAMPAATTSRRPTRPATKAVVRDTFALPERLKNNMNKL